VVESFEAVPDVVLSVFGEPVAVRRLITDPMLELIVVVAVSADTAAVEIIETNTTELATKRILTFLYNWLDRSKCIFSVLFKLMLSFRQIAVLKFNINGLASGGIYGELTYSRG